MKKVTLAELKEMFPAITETDCAFSLTLEQIKKISEGLPEMVDYFHGYPVEHHDEFWKFGRALDEFEESLSLKLFGKRGGIRFETILGTEYWFLFTEHALENGIDYDGKDTFSIGGIKLNIESMICGEGELVEDYEQ